MNRRDMIKVLGLAGIGTALLPSFSYANELPNVSKWESTGLLDGLSEKARAKMIVLLDNTELSISRAIDCKYTTEVERNFVRDCYLPIVRYACEPFLEDDRFQTMRLPSGITSTGIIIAARSQWSQIVAETNPNTGLDIGYGFYKLEHQFEFIRNSFSIPLRNTIDAVLNNQPNMTTYMYMPIVFVGPGDDPHNGVRRYGTFIRYARLRNGPRESV